MQINILYKPSQTLAQVWLERIPNFELVDPSAVTWAGGQVRGPRKCLVKFPVN